MNLKVSEMFYSLQGEGARAGVPTFFVRLQGCTAKNACAKVGIMCDTEFESGRALNIEDLHRWMNETQPACKEITWTGGEPTDQLTEDVVAWFKERGYYQAIETSGIRKAPAGLDFICVSPKVAEHIVQRNFPDGVTELRYVRHSGQSIPQPLTTAKYYWISPHSDGAAINPVNLKHCIDLCLQNPKWRISVQQHKQWNVL